MPMSTKRKAPAKLAAPAVRSSAKVPTKATVNEAKASVSNTDAIQSSQMETIEISSDEPSDEDLSDDEEEDQPAKTNGEAAPAPAAVNGKPAGRDGADPEESDGEPTSPSFGELLRDNGAIDVPALLQQSSAAGSNAAVQRPRTAIVPPSHQSLTTVLTQALKTDDTDLLESCLHTTDLTTIRNTIERIDSSLAGTLLTSLAARLYRRPGRAGNLMTWVQWTLVSHGGALASQPKVVQSLSSLQKVLAERAKGLNSLLALKGKLDLLDGQMDLRRKMQRGSALPQLGDAGEDDEDVIWVEGESDNKEPANGALRPRRRRNQHSDDEEDDEDETGPLANGVVGDSEDEEDDDDDDVEEDDSEGEDGDEPLDEDEVDHDDVDESMGEDEESDVEAAAPPSKVQKMARSPFSKRK
ncbi:Small subunit (SSU) processome component [Purpureocillium takamizusanense]|uniref:Small subunit (SSU) processome component n=1 Tax=Purpureocillium takamizusanense TaxID=2060973 RepID=A0A9Q8Q9K5_9HYPO|nr:Small subunit (SSU) processome component [Purpureocillium takamizusanense]UNI16073.1 Small subunit (SSU) processome component [Purpureocillium takamizusanense]